MNNKLNSPISPPSGGRRKFLNQLLLVLFVLAALADVALIIFIAILVFVSYSGSNDPTSVNGVAFPIAVGIYIIVGLPAGGITYALWSGYQKTKPAK